MFVVGKKTEFKILLVGDVFGDPGLAACSEFIPALKSSEKIEFVIVNGENSAKDGRGITEKSSEAIFAAGADIITTGNHIWRHEPFFRILHSSNNIVRPINFPGGTLGKGFVIKQVGAIRIAVVNAMGRVFFRELLNCPFREMESILLYLKDKADIVILDFHAEATSEKQALGFYLDGKISAMFGTHTHVQTSDNRILPKGTAFITDIGFCGALNSCIGVEKYTVINQYLSQMPARFKAELERPYVFSGAILTMELDQDRWIAKSFDRVLKHLT